MILFLNYFQLSFDVWKKKFRYEFHGKLNKNSLMDKKFPTEIFVPKIHYPNKKYIVKTSKDITWRVSPQNEDILQLFIKPSLFTNEVTRTSSFISISPKLAIVWMLCFGIMDLQLAMNSNTKSNNFFFQLWDSIVLLGLIL